MATLRHTAPPISAQDAFTADDLRLRAAGKLLTNDDAAAAQASSTKDSRLRTLRPAAVLIPIIDRAPEATALLTLRTDGLSVHAGQISFPGGKVHPDDATPAETALREAEEEIGLRRNEVDLLGFLDCFRTNKNFCIVPAIGVVAPSVDLKIDNSEVAEVFEVPLRFLMSPENHEWHEREVEGMRRDYHAIPYEGHYIWGITARIIRSMFERLYSSGPDAD